MGEAHPIEVKGLAKSYRLGFWLSKRVEALRGIDFVVRAGQVYGLLGPNGAGKSTTIKILMNLVQPTAGSARLFGQDPRSESCRRMVGFVPENPSPYEYLTGAEFLSLAGTLCGLSGKELATRRAEVLEQVGLSRAASLQVRRYSKGMVQRLAVGQALLPRPKLLILDEPTSGLDPVGRREMRDLILGERNRGTTILFCTHIISDIEAVCDRVAVLVGGKLLRDGDVRELVTSSVAVEATFENVNAEHVQASGVPVEKIQTVGDRIVVRADDAGMHRLLPLLLARGGRLIHWASVRFSLEDLFFRTLQEAGQASSVGAEVQ